jgi:hypothetical protein
LSELRIYSPDECGPDGYPLAWHAGDPAIKDLVREQAGRCVRCKHPYRVGEHGNGEWSPCDQECTHDGPYGWRRPDQVVEVCGSFGDFAYAQVRVGEGEGQIVARWRILTVHHLTGEKADCRWWNLAALCQRCHLTIQGKVRMEQVYPFEHSEWFRPYAAGYYAATYLGEDLSREETVERMDDLLALEAAA